MCQKVNAMLRNDMLLRNTLRGRKLHRTNKDFLQATSNQLLASFDIIICTLLEKRRLALKSHPIKHTNTLEESRAPQKIIIIDRALLTREHAAFRPRGESLISAIHY